MQDVNEFGPNVAGVFYPQNPNELLRHMKDYLKNNYDFTDVSAPLSIIVPHAGYVYSAEVAGRAYAIIEHFKDMYDSAVIIGPAHHVLVDTPAVLNKDYKTPLGISLKDDNIITQLLNDDLVEINEEAFAEEHSTEVQIPFLQYINKDFKIVNILTGPYEIDKVVKLIDKVYKMPRTLLVISSDLSHFNPYHIAKENDINTIKNIKSYNEDQIFPEDACGSIGIRALLKSSKKKFLKPEILSYCNSGDKSSNKLKVVGYGSLAFFNS